MVSWMTVRRWDGMQVGDDPIKLARFHAIQEASDALTKGRAEYDKSIENQELNEMVRCAVSRTTCRVCVLNQRQRTQGCARSIASSARMTAACHQADACRNPSQVRRLYARIWRV